MSSSKSTTREWIVSASSRTVKWSISYRSKLTTDNSYEFLTEYKKQLPEVTREKPNTGINWTTVKTCKKEMGLGVSCG